VFVIGFCSCKRKLDAASYRIFPVRSLQKVVVGAVDLNYFYFDDWLISTVVWFAANQRVWGSRHDGGGDNIDFLDSSAQNDVRRKQLS